MSAKFKFPTPKNCTLATPAVLCPAERVICLYNQNSGKQAARIGKNVRRWFFAEAEKKGWAGVHFLPDVQSNHGAGCILWRAPEKIDIVVNITSKTLVLLAETTDKS